MQLFLHYEKKNLTIKHSSTPELQKVITFRITSLSWRAKIISSSYDNKNSSSDNLPDTLNHFFSHNINILTQSNEV